MAETLKTKTRLCSWGTSRAVRIPKDICEEVGIEVESKLYMNAGRDESGTYIIIRPDDQGHKSYGDAPYRSMDELFAGYRESYKPSECDWGDDIGGEVVE